VAKKTSGRKQKERRTRKKDRAQRRKRLLLAGISILLLITLALPVFVTGGRTASPRPAGSDVHWHIALSVVVDGQALAVPDLENDRFLDVHDSATTLSRALAAHGMRLTETCLNDNCIDDGGDLTVSVNGQAIEDFARYVLREDDEVRIEFSAASSWRVVPTTGQVPIGREEAG
jgi:hypothetical protein